MPLDRSRYRLCFLLILAIALFLRSGGLFWGLPNAAHPDYSYHPDEVFHVVWAAWLAQGQLIAKHFMYGGTLYYSLLNGYRYLAEALSGHLGGGNFMADVLIVGRIGTVMFSFLAVCLTAAATRRLYGDLAGLIGGAALALFPAHAFLAQNVRPDELGAALVALLLYLCARRLTQTDARERAWPDFCLGLLLGSMLALRFPLAVFGLAPLSVLWLQRRPTSLLALRAFLLDRRLWALLLAIPLSYALCSPHTLLHPDGLRAGLQVQWAYQSGVFEDAVGRGPGLYQYGVRMLAEALGWPLYALAAFAVLAAAWRRRPADLLLLAALFPYLFLTANASWVVVRYTLPLLPVLAVLIGGLLVEPGVGRAFTRRATGIVIAAVLAFTLLPDLALRRSLASPNKRELVGAWLQAHVPADTGIVVFEQYGGDTFYRPTLPASVEVLVFPLQEAVDPGVLARLQPAPLLLLSEDVYGNMDRLGAAHPKPRIAQLARLLRPDGEYRLVRSFEPEIRFLGIDFTSWFRSQDYRIIEPGFRLYARNGAAASP